MPEVHKEQWLLFGALCNFITLWDSIYDTIEVYPDISNEFDKLGLDIEDVNTEVKKLSNKLDKVINL